MPTMYDLQSRRAEFAEALREKRQVATEMAMNAGTKMEDLRAAQGVVDDLVERIAHLDKEIDLQTQKSRENLKMNGGAGATMTFQEAAGAYFAALGNGGNVRDLPKMAYEQLGELPEGNADQGKGSVLLPKELSRRLLLAPDVVNPLRKRMGVTNISGLTMPKMSFTVADDGFMTKAGASAKEMAMGADTVEFGRHKALFSAKISTTLLRQSPLDLQAAILRGLDSAMNAKELKVIFAATPATGEEHMSLYAKNDSSQYLVTAVEGADTLTAVIAACADLEEMYQAGASIAMRRRDYYAAMMALTNGAEALFSDKPAQVLGYPVDFVDQATTPVCGNFAYLHINYDAPPYLDQDKTPEKDLSIFTEVATYDIHRLMNAAFRLATVANTAE